MKYCICSLRRSRGKRVLEDHNHRGVDDVLQGHPFSKGKHKTKLYEDSDEPERIGRGVECVDSVNDAESMDHVSKQRREE